ncbi:Hypothetical predicted protein [Paramuricea clavata]|uniref:Uncharacterized protein n=1 Tax=Paramuricea clavata TaxID=317549 RepID=A0A7D9HY44_PARCT|nr:Hypothetical predicted protein [Paramuricea clavata]
MADTKDKRKRKDEEDDNEESQTKGKGLVWKGKVPLPVVHWVSYEHNILGNSVHLPDVPGGNNLTLPNGVHLSFGNIIAMAGDYYGIPNAPIIDPLNPEKIDDGALQRFKNAYNTLAFTPNEGKYKERLDKLLKLLADDDKNAKKAGNCFHSNKEWDEATGGVWVAGIPIIPGFMIKLAEHNYDHFEPQAKTTYVVGHGYAIEKAREAGRSKENNREKLLFEAYSIDGFACHFLTDAFATGHMRTPRVALPKNVTPAVIGDLLCKYMHDEDSKFGIRVTNVRGDTLVGYGDGRLMEEGDKEYFNLVVEAVQNSVNQVHQAYKDSNLKLDSRAVTDLIPFVDRKKKNNTPLFEVKNGEIHRRSDINDLQDKKTITNWWGSSTALKLRLYKPHNSAI